MAWTYEQATGHLLDADGKIIATGYAGGNEGKNPEGKNNPDMQDVPKVGPLPVGLYVLNTPVPQSQLGPFAIPLIPSKDNEMFGRGGFYIHGDRTDAPGCASEGCIIMPRQIRDLVWKSEDHEIQVIRGNE